MIKDTSNKSIGNRDLHGHGSADSSLHYLLVASWPRTCAYTYVPGDQALYQETILVSKVDSVGSSDMVILCNAAYLCQSTKRDTE